jgi:hypothetical protein
VDDEEWLKWNNVHRYARQGVNFREMSEPQRERAFGLMRAALSAKGFEESRNVMRLNGYLAELLNNSTEYGDDLYHLTVMGAPSDTAPWGWQLDGHHLIVNYFVLGDQVVMTPSFMGSEPVTVSTGKYAGTAVLQDEQNKGLLYACASADQQKIAAIQPRRPRTTPRHRHLRQRRPYAGLPGAKLTAGSARCCWADWRIRGQHGGRHAKVRMDEVRAQLDRTHFAWIGGVAEDACLLPHPQPGDSDRVRSPDAGGVAGSARAGQAARPQCRAHTQRE